MGEAYIEIFHSPGCVGCPIAEKMVEELSEELEGDITVEKIDITIDLTRAMEYGIMSVPAIVVNGILRSIGVPKSKEELKKAILEELEG